MISFVNMSFKGNDLVPVVTVQQTVEGWIEDVKSQLGRVLPDLEVLKGIVSGLLTNGVLDDKK